MTEVKKIFLFLENRLSKYEDTFDEKLYDLRPVCLLQVEVFLSFSFTMLFYDLFIKEHSINWFSVLKIIDETVSYFHIALPFHSQMQYTCFFKFAISPNCSDFP